MCQQQYYIIYSWNMSRTNFLIVCWTQPRKSKPNIEMFYEQFWRCMWQACHNLRRYGFPTNCPEIQLMLSCNNLCTNSFMEKINDTEIWLKKFVAFMQTFTYKLHRGSIKGVNHIYEIIYVRAVLWINYTEIKLKIVICYTLLHFAHILIHRPRFCDKLCKDGFMCNLHKLENMCYTLHENGSKTHYILETDI